MININPTINISNDTTHIRILARNIDLCTDILSVVSETVRATLINTTNPFYYSEYTIKDNYYWLQGNTIMLYDNKSLDQPLVSEYERRQNLPNKDIHV